MKAIRGAITVGEDSPEEIKKAVSKLLSAIMKENGLTDENIVCILFSNTEDLRSYYPAKAAREEGFFSCALYSSLEPTINGALEKCIRVMLLTDTENKPKHIYLEGARKLRKDVACSYNIAIDGPAGSGKSTVSKILAKRLDILYLDTGAMYRACALACLNARIDCKDESQVRKFIDVIDVSVKYENGAQVTFLNGENVSEKIRTPEISMLASIVSAHKCIRNKMVDMQRKIASENSCVLDGRDIGTNVLPDAEFKFFLTAAPEIRAERRMKENAAKGISQPFESVLEEIILRDKQDASREYAPLKKAADAFEVDTGHLSIEEVVSLIIKNIQGRI